LHALGWGYQIEVSMYSTKGEERMSSTQMSDPRDLFLHELGDVLYAEKTLLKALPKLQEEASDDELAQGFGGSRGPRRSMMTLSPMSRRLPRF